MRFVISAAVLAMGLTAAPAAMSATPSFMRDQVLASGLMLPPPPTKGLMLPPPPTAGLMLPPPPNFKFHPAGIV